LLASLFLSWYDVGAASITRHAGAFALVFSSGSSDAWDTILGTSVVLTACAVVISALLVRWLTSGAQRVVLIAVGVALAAAGLVGYRLVASPQAPRGVEGAYFTRAKSASTPSIADASTANGAGAAVALCATLGAAIAGGTLTFAARAAT
jgi:hypothetical protein